MSQNRAVWVLERKDGKLKWKHQEQWGLVRTNALLAEVEVLGGRVLVFWEFMCGDWNMGSGSSGRFLSLGIHAEFYHSLKAGVQWTAEALCWVGSGCTLSQPLKWNLHCLRSGTYEKEISWLKCRCVSLLAALVPVPWLRKVSMSCLSKVILLFQKNPTHSVVKYTHIYIFNFVSFLEQPK